MLPAAEPPPSRAAQTLNFSLLACFLHMAQSVLAWGVIRVSRNSSLAVAITAAALSLAAPRADATVYIGLQQDAGPVVTVASNAAGFAFYSGAFGNFELVSVFGMGQPVTPFPLFLQDSAGAINNAGSANAGTLTIYVTSTGNTGPLGLVPFTSGFATVDLTSTWTETLQTYLDPGDGIYALTTLLGSASFAGVNSETDHVDAATGPGPFSVTSVFRFVASTYGGGTSSASITDAPPPSIPEPTTLAIRGLGLTGLGLMRRKRAA